MQNIEAILKQFGLEIPKEQAEEFRKTFHEGEVEKRMQFPACALHYQL